MNLEIYKEHILDLYKNPHNKGNLKKITIEPGAAINQSGKLICDKVSV